MRYIKLNNTDKVCFVDNELYDYLNQFNWRLSSWGYAQAWVGHAKSGLPSSMIGMHTLVISRYEELVPELQTDHINQNKLDNQRLNLRQITKSQNIANSKLPTTNRSGYKGVSWHEKNQNWRATVSRDNRQIHVGCYPTPEQANNARLALIETLGL